MKKYVEKYIMYHETIEISIKGLKHNGIKWSPKNNAWQRLLNNNARWAAKDIIKKLEV